MYLIYVCDPSLCIDLHMNTSPRGGESVHPPKELFFQATMAWGQDSPPSHEVNLKGHHCVGPLTAPSNPIQSFLLSVTEAEHRRWWQPQWSLMQTTNQDVLLYREGFGVIFLSSLLSFKLIKDCSEAKKDPPSLCQDCYLVQEEEEGHVANQVRECFCLHNTREVAPIASKYSPSKRVSPCQSKLRRSIYTPITCSFQLHASSFPVGGLLWLVPEDRDKPQGLCYLETGGKEKTKGTASFMQEETGVRRCWSKSAWMSCEEANNAHLPNDWNIENWRVRFWSKTWILDICWWRESLKKMNLLLLSICCVILLWLLAFSHVEVFFIIKKGIFFWEKKVVKMKNCLTSPHSCYLFIFLWSYFLNNLFTVQNPEGVEITNWWDGKFISWSFFLFQCT